MTQDEARQLQALCNEVIEYITENRPESCRNQSVNWVDLLCTDVLVSDLHPDRWPILVIEEADPGAIEFASAVHVEIHKRNGILCDVRCEW